jgi:hypothetical protein
MKKLFIILLLSSCYSPRVVVWKVTDIKRDAPNEAWIITAISSRGSDRFITYCKPDSIGSRFFAAPKRIKK